MSAETCDMSDVNSWSNEATVVEYLADQLLLGRLTLVLGSGVSYGFGLPSWESLVRRLCTATGYTFPEADYPRNQGLAQIANEVKSAYFLRDEPGFVELVRRELYTGADTSYSSLVRDRLFSAIGALVTSSGRGGVSRVVTLNYDDCLERYLEIMGFVVHSTYNDPATYWLTRSDITILHPHGFLPEASTRSRSASIVLDQASFSAAIGAVTSPWYQSIVSLMRSSTCLLVGLGSGDQNLLSMLMASTAEHPARNAGLPYSSVMLAAGTNGRGRGTLRSHGCCLHEVNDYHDHLPAFLLAICQRAAITRRSELRIG